MSRQQIVHHCANIDSLGFNFVQSHEKRKISSFMLPKRRLQPTMALCSIAMFLVWTRVVRGQTYHQENSTCQVEMNGKLMEKSIGDVWNSVDDLCQKYTCEMGPNGEALEKSFREYCLHSCHNDYDLVQKKGQCCGECVKRRCSMNNETYQIGAMWKSSDQCTFFECSATADITSYRKSCPIVQNCPTHRLTIKDCCTYCELDARSPNEEQLADFVHSPNKYTSIMAKETYRNHPCRRECVDGAAPMICNYTFLVEWYETLSKACYECPFNRTDCSRPHCIVGDGFRRSVLVVNRMMPGPAIEVCRGDTIVADIENALMGDSTSIHWHGLHQRGSPHYDGVVQVTQCPIPPHTTFRYTVKANNVGTHWWHSHVGMQRADGAFGALLIREPKSKLPPHIRNAYDFDSIDHLMIMQDWNHKTGASDFSSFHHSIGINKPKNILINGRGRYFEPNFEVDEKKQLINDSQTTTTTSTTEAPIADADSNAISNRAFSVVGVKQKRSSFPDSIALLETEHIPYEVFTVDKGFRYRFRTINSGFLNCPLEISIDNHTMDVIASDGHYFDAVRVDSFVTYAGERFDFVVFADQTIGNYWIRIRGLMDCDDRFLKAQQGAILRYGGAILEEPSSPLQYDYHRGGFQLNSLNKGTGHVDSVSIAELTASEADTPELLTEEADYKFYVYYDFYDKDFPQFNHPELYSIQAVSKNGDKFFGPQLNHISMKMPPQPLLIGREKNDESKFCNSSSLTERNINCRHEFCECSHVLQVHLNASVELILIDEGYKFDANHPFHLHGHDFRVVGMERIQPTGVTVQQIKQLDDSGGIKRRLSGAPIKDTVTVPDGGYTVLRFLATNPGFWLLHCHIDFHVEVGMALVFKVGDYNQMTPLPPDFPTCSNFMPQPDGDNSENSKNKPQISKSSIAKISFAAFILLVEVNVIFGV